MANLKSNLGSKMTNLANNMTRANYRATTALPSLGDGNIFNAWYNMDRAMRERHEAQEAIKKQNAWDEMMARNPYGNGNIQQTMPQFDIGEGVVADRNGWRGTPQQQTTNPFGIDTSGWGNPSGNSINVGSFDTPKQNAWTTAFGGVKSFNQPPTDNPQAQAVEGQQISPNYMSLMSNGQMTPQQQQEFNDKMNLRQWIEWDAKMNGVTNPLVSAQRYGIFVEPLKKQAEVNDLRNAYLTLQNPKSTDEEKMSAIALIEYDKKNPYMNEDHDMTMDRYNYNMGMIRNPNFNVGNNILSVLGDYEEGEQWMSPDGTGDSRTQCSNWVSDVLRKAGIKGLGSANGDELMRQFGKAYHNGLDGIQPGDVLNFKDHVGIYAGNGQYVARNSSGGVHQGSMEEAVRFFGQPLGYGSVREFSGGNTKYIRDPNQVTPREKFNAQQAYQEKLLRLREEAINNKQKQTSLNGQLSKFFDSKGNLFMSDRDRGLLKQNIEDLASDIDAAKEDNRGADISLKNNIIELLTPYYNNLINNGADVNTARALVRQEVNNRIKELDKKEGGKIQTKYINDIIDEITMPSFMGKHHRLYSQESKRDGEPNGNRDYANNLREKRQYGTVKESKIPNNANERALTLQEKNAILNQINYDKNFNHR